MKKISLPILVAAFTALTHLPVKAGTVTVKVSDFKQIFEGVGGTIDGYLGHWVSLNDANRDLAARLVAEDINLHYVKNYMGNTPDVAPGLYDNFVAAVNDLKVYRPDIKVQISVNNFPDYLEKVDDKGNNLKGEYDETIPDIYKKIADYYFQVIEGFYVRGLPVDQLDLVNEPGGLHRAHYYGRLFADSVDELRNMLNDPGQNPQGIPMPEIVGPSHWGVEGGRKWLEEWKSNLPRAWENVDIVSTHGYQGGWISQNYANVLKASEGKPFMNNEQTGKLQKGDRLFETFGNDEPDYIGDVSIALRISDAINGGVNSFFIFNLNNPSGNNAALIKTPFKNKKPLAKSKVYSGFKQLTSLQPENSFRVGHNPSDLGNMRVVTFRNPGENLAYIHVTNIGPEAEEVEINITENGLGTGFLGITSVQAWVSDELLDEGLVVDESYMSARDSVSFSVSPYSVNSYKVTFDPEQVFPDKASFNVALNKATEVSSLFEEGTYYTGNQAVDGNKIGDNSRWRSEKKAGFPQWIEIDLLQQHTIDSLSLYTGAGTYKNPINDFRLQKWNGLSWEDVLVPPFNTDPTATFQFEPTQADLLRLYINEVDSKEVRLFELEVAGKKAAPVNLTATSGAGTLLTWAEDGGAETYKVYQSVDDGAFQVIATDIFGGRYVNAGKVTPEARYVYGVTAIDHSGYESGFSNYVEVQAGPPSGAMGDINFDGVTNFYDALLILSALGSAAGDDGFIAQADYNHSGVIDFADFRTWLRFYRLFLLGR